MPDGIWSGTCVIVSITEADSKNCIEVTKGFLHQNLGLCKVDSGELLVTLCMVEVLNCYTKPRSMVVHHTPKLKFVAVEKVPSKTKLMCKVTNVK